MQPNLDATPLERFEYLARVFLAGNKPGAMMVTTEQMKDILNIIESQRGGASERTAVESSN